MTDRELMQQWLDAIAAIPEDVEGYLPEALTNVVIATRERLAQPMFHLRSHGDVSAEELERLAQPVQEPQPVEDCNPHPEYRRGYAAGLEAGESLAELRKKQPAQEPKLSCGVDFADGLLTVSVGRICADGSMEVIHCEQIEIPVQEPVVRWVCKGCGHEYMDAPTSCDCMESTEYDRVEYYTAPQPRREWVGLTDEAIWLEYQRFWPFHPADEPRLAQDIAKFARAIEAKLKEKNA